MNTLKNKAKFFAQYYGLKMLWDDRRKLLYQCSGGHIEEAMYDEQFCGYSYYLELTPLSSITDEDAIEVAKIGFEQENDLTVSEGKMIVSQLLGGDGLTVNDCQIIFIADCLRSKGYALSWMGISVDQQIEFGWVKLKK